MCYAELFWESKLVSTIAFNTIPSELWLGNFSPQEFDQLLIII
ncbi:MAG: hypothetical protein ORN85_09255 [Sediminibacterium sp.]|nr:hypothetical protein [Sediminibacterium sp.]